MQQRPAGVLAALGPRKFQDGTENQLIQSKLYVSIWLSYVTSFVKTVPVAYHAESNFRYQTLV